MVKKLSSIENYINANVDEFSQHLNKILPKDVINFINHLQSKTHIYLFSGIIRNYFLKKNYELRDIDFMIEDDLDVNSLFPDLLITRNSFGGYKLKIDNLPIDLWGVSNTWGLNCGQLKLPFKHLEAIPDTTFFNCSSIVFSMNDKKFIIGKPFLRFLRDKQLEALRDLASRID